LNLLLFGAVMKRTALPLTLILAIVAATVITQKVSLTEANFYPYKTPYCNISIQSPQHMRTYDTGNILLIFTAKTKDNIPPSYYYFYSIDGQDIQSSVKINVQIVSQEYITDDTLEPYTETTLRGQAELPSLTNGPHSITVFTGGFLRNGTIYPAQLDIDSFSATAWFFVGTASGSPASSISGLTIVSPQNKTYNPKFLTLNATAYWFFADINSMSYSIDGLGSHSLSLERPQTAFNPMNGTVIGAAALPELAEGPHKITVYVTGTAYFPETRDSMEQATVYFTIDATPPSISSLSVENKTYNQLDLPLDFSLNEPTSWIGYSLDDEANITLTGNTTLTLKEGLHSLVLYANDTAGNMGSSKTIYFTIDQVFPTIPVVAGVVTTAVVGVGLGLLLYRIKRK
jgi:hypothetical protein